MDLATHLNKPVVLALSCLAGLIVPFHNNGYNEITMHIIATGLVYATGYLFVFLADSVSHSGFHIFDIFASGINLVFCRV